jgi:methionyl-tRNA formyltransferase
MKLIFMGTPDFAVPALIALAKAGHEIASVFTKAPRPAGRGQKERLSPVHLAAQALGLPVSTPSSLKGDDMATTIKHYQADICIVTAYGLLLPTSILQLFPLGCLNIHPSILPRWGMYYANG